MMYGKLIAEVEEPRLPDLDDMQRDIGEWEESMAYAAVYQESNHHYGSASDYFGEAYRAIDKAREQLKMIEQEDS